MNYTPTEMTCLPRHKKKRNKNDIFPIKLGHFVEYNATVRLNCDCKIINTS